MSAIIFQANAPKLRADKFLSTIQYLRLKRKWRHSLSLIQALRDASLSTARKINDPFRDQ